MFNTQEVANIAWAYAGLEIKNETLMAALGEQTMQEGFSVHVEYTGGCQHSLDLWHIRTQKRGIDGGT